MSARDPETGQFVSSKDSDYDWDELEIQHVSTNYGVPAADLSGATSFACTSITAASEKEWEPAGGISRGELAELVALQHVINVYINSTETADGSVVGQLIVSTEDDTQGVGNLPGGFDDIGSTVIDQDEMQVTTDPAHVDILEAFGTGPFSDGASGVGGGGSAGQHAKSLNFKAWGGFGPTYDVHSEFRGHPQFSVWNVDDAGIHMDYEGQFLWKVHEVESPSLR